MARDYGIKDVKGRGLQIYTAIDLTAQDTASRMLVYGIEGMEKRSRRLRAHVQRCRACSFTSTCRQARSARSSEAATTISAIQPRAEVEAPGRLALQTVRALRQPVRAGDRPRTEPEPSMRACWRGSASRAKTTAGGAATVVLCATTRSWSEGALMASR